MATTALIDLVNSALVMLGQEPLVDLSDENTDPVVAFVKGRVDVLIRALLVEADWNCARKTSVLPRVSTAEEMGWLYMYQLPTEPACLKVVQISTDGGDRFIDVDSYYNTNAGSALSFFDIDGDKLLCNSETVAIKYTAEIDASRFDPLLADAFATKLASELCFCLTASAANTEALDKLATRKLRKAKSRNAMSRNINRPEGDVLSSRFYSGSSDRFLRADMSEQEG